MDRAPNIIAIELIGNRFDGSILRRPGNASVRSDDSSVENGARVELNELVREQRRNPAWASDSRTALDDRRSGRQRVLGNHSVFAKMQRPLGVDRSCDDCALADQYIGLAVERAANRCLTSNADVAAGDDIAGGTGTIGNDEVTDCEQRAIGPRPASARVAELGDGT